MFVLSQPSANLGDWKVIQHGISTLIYASELICPTLCMKKLGYLYTSLHESLEGHSQVANTLTIPASFTVEGTVVQKQNSSTQIQILIVGSLLAYPEIESSQDNNEALSVSNTNSTYLLFKVTQTTKFISNSNSIIFFIN